MTTAALYRCLYGEDFIVPSVDSILPYVDRVLFCLHDKPWGEATEVEYRGVTIQFPSRFDRVMEKAYEAAGDKFCRVRHYSPTPKGEWAELIDRYAWRYDRVVLMEPDQVFLPEEAEKFFASTGVCNLARQVELWKPPTTDKWWRVPQRERHGPVLWDLAQLNAVPAIGGTTGSGAGGAYVDATCHNYGFAFSKRTMFWKQMTALAFSKTIGDSTPNPDWYEDVWLKWQEGDRNLEIARAYAKAIPHVLKYEERHPLR